MTREALSHAHLDRGTSPGSIAKKYWNANGIAPMFEGLMRRHASSRTKPHVTEVQRRLGDPQARRRTGLHPRVWTSTPNTSPPTGTRWRSAAQRRRTGSRRDWLVREVLMAETDEQAFRYAVDDTMGRAMREYVLPTLRMFGADQF